ncbi:MAG: GIY-YIG nuclease family protein [Ruminococcus sp.]|nr:GIY-YIG nuclease family protein [Ruminococcus sp.]
MEKENYKRRPNHQEFYEQIKLLKNEYQYLVSIGERPKTNKRDYVGDFLGISGRQVTNIINEFEKPTDNKALTKKLKPFLNKISGFIYIITNKSTGTYYIGKSESIPTRRWNEHLRKIFPIENITDYKFETLEVVPKSVDLSKREQYYIEKYYKNDPEKILNRQIYINGKMKRINF